MNFKETHQLLIFIAQYDNRRIDDGVVIAWQAIVADLALDDARQAVIGHFSTTTDYLMPVHVRRGVEELRRERRRQVREAREADLAAIEAADPTRRDRSEAIEELIAELRAKLPEGNPDSLRYASGYWREQREARERQERAEPNPHYDPATAAAQAALADAGPQPTEQP
ncbi:MAG TPA: hypothetical protein VFC19_49380 [Candidatus Limnocylindrales bacterium]|nr:hypothetical protein [Candidatus Limnocylindrales bacterium]